MNKLAVGLGLTCLVSLSVLSGCGGAPQVSHDNRRVIESVLTAVSAKNPEWLAANEKLVDERKAAGKMSETEYKEFRSIIELGRAGRWDEAAGKVFALREAQTVTNEDLDRLEARAVEPSLPPRKSGKPRT